jgi:hypothetical protein
MSTMNDSEILQKALGGLQRCVGQTPDAGSYVFTTLNLLSQEGPSNGVVTDTGETVTQPKVQDISSITKFTELRQVRLSGQAISDLSPIVSLPFLAELQADHNTLNMSIENCAAKWCKEQEEGKAWRDGDRSIGSILEVVNLSHNQIIGPLGDHSKHRFLRSLDLSHNNIQTLGAGLFMLYNLKHLNISNNGITIIESNDLPTCLTSLDVSSNGLDNIKFIDNLLSLEKIVLDSNRVGVLNALSSCSLLRICSAKNNVLRDFDCIRVLQDNEHLQELHILGNPICAVEFVRLRVIAILQQLRTLDNDVVDATDKVKSEVLTGSEHDKRKERWNKMIGTEFTDMVKAFKFSERQDEENIEEAIRLSAENAVNTAINQATPRVDTAGEFATRPR